MAMTPTTPPATPAIKPTLELLVELEVAPGAEPAVVAEPTPVWPAPVFFGLVGCAPAPVAAPVPVPVP
jgi:hypothetical protein